jgi:hypothetical protein
MPFAGKGQAESTTSFLGHISFITSCYFYILLTDAKAMTAAIADTISVVCH